MLHILLVDDDPDELMFMNSALDIIGVNRFKCLYASTGSDARAILNVITPDFIFVDLNMPAENGLQLLHTFSSDESLTSTKLILYSTTISTKVAAEAMRYGAYACCAKTAGISNLIDALRPILGAPIKQMA